jgi:predicted transcriptional regulator
MVKKPFTTRIDEEVLALAQRIADIERRSVTSVIEVAILHYATERGLRQQNDIDE